jgi:hypothetical protein
MTVFFSGRLVTVFGSELVLILFKVLIGLRAATAIGAEAMKGLNGVTATALIGL